jgi:hypothetical protein
MSLFKDLFRKQENSRDFRGDSARTLLESFFHPSSLRRTLRFKKVAV